jgi:hypothetical protein
MSAIGECYSESSQSLSSELSSSAISFLFFEVDAFLFGRMKSLSDSDSDDEDELISTIVGVFRFETLLLPLPPPAFAFDFRAGLRFALTDVDFALAVDFAFAALAFDGFDAADIQPSPSDTASGLEDNLLEDPPCFRC